MNWFGESPEYPALTSFLNCGGRLEIGHIYEMDVSVIAVDERNVVWEGRSTYKSLGDLLTDAEQAIRDLEA